MKTITFYSYKGGVGRSLALANISTRLTEYGKKVCLLDFDLEAPGLPFKFSELLDKENIEIKKGVVDYIYQFANEGKISSKISDFSYSFFDYNLSGTAAVNTILIPAGDMSQNYWKKLSSINWNELLFENSSGLAFLLNLKESIKNEFSPDYLLIDSRTGISEMSGITLSLLADDVVVLAANNRENLAGAKKIIQSISDPENNIFGRIPKITFVLSRVPFTDGPEDRAKEQNLVSKIEREFDKLITEVNVIHSDRELELDEQIKIGHVIDGIAPQVSRDYLKLFDKLTEIDFTEEQKNSFRNLKEAERFYQIAVSENAILRKLEFIKKAIEINPNNKEYFLFRASIYDQLQDDNNVITDCDKAIYLDTKNFRAYELKGKIQLKLKDYSSSRHTFETILGFDKNHIGAKLGLAEIYIYERDYDRALYIYNEIIKLDGESSVAFIGRANVKLSNHNYLAALEDVYQALMYDTEYVEAFAALAEINARINNLNEFYLNIERALKLDIKWTENFMRRKKLAELFINDKRFEKLEEKYNLQLQGEMGNN